MPCVGSGALPHPAVALLDARARDRGNTAIFSIVNSVLLRPLITPDPSS